jgi:outer membrane immunogenic protein
MRKILLAGLALTALCSAPAFAADIPAKAPVYKAPVVIPFSWTGWYVGANIGYGWGNGDTFFDPLPSAAAFINLAPTTLGPDPKGVLGGGQLGFNWQTGQWVWGFETDFQGSGIKGSVTQTPIIQNNGTPFPGAGFLQASEKIDWFGTLRLRAGIAADRLLLYVTGGLIYGHVNYAAETDFRPVGTVHYPASFSKTKAGWTGGGGLEWAFAPNWSAKAEYLYYDLGDETFTANPSLPLPPFQVRYTWQTTGHIARVGVNYRFGSY